MLRAKAKRKLCKNVLLANVSEERQFRGIRSRLQDNNRQYIERVTEGHTYQLSAALRVVLDR
jgi:hypothetical protein